MYKLFVILFIILNQLLLGNLSFIKNIMEWGEEKS